MKKILLIFILILFISIPTKVKCVNISSDLLQEQSKSFGLNDFFKETKKFSSEEFEDVDLKDIFNSAIKGNIDNMPIIKKIPKLIGIQIKNTLKTMVAILSIILIHSILRVITDNLEDNNVSKVIYFAEYILIISLIMNNFTDIINTVKTTVNNLVNFMNILVPLLMTLMIYTGSITTSGFIEPFLLFIISLIGNIISKLLLPGIMLITVLSLVSKLSDKIQISKITNFLKSSVVWTLGIILTIFVGVLSLEGTLTSSVDGITAKTAKAAVSSLIPVVGKILGDSVDSVLGCGIVIKNAIGIVGVLVIIGICIMPIIKLTILSIMYSIASGIIEPLAENKIVKLIEEIGGIFKLLLAITCSISVLFIIGITLSIKISNIGMMYR